MKFYLIRHGKAAYNAPTDEARPLTEEGIQQAQRNGAFLKALGVMPTAIYTSPRKRAQQTAQYIGSALNCDPIVDDAVNFEFTAQKALQLATNHPPESSLIFVGHNPSMSEVVGQLTGTRTDMSTCAIAYIKDIDLPQARFANLKWLMTPKALNAIINSE
ncbi:MAG: phosphohistidine phosphatase SixA [Chloroflexota bacterium]